MRAPATYLAGAFHNQDILSVNNRVNYFVGVAPTVIVVANLIDICFDIYDLFGARIDEMIDFFLDLFGSSNLLLFAKIPAFRKVALSGRGRGVRNFELENFDL